MPYSGLESFIDILEKNGELHRIKTFADPVLEITEVTDRITKNNGKALLFENTGTAFPLLINAYGSDKRIALAIGRKDIDEIGQELTGLFSRISRPHGTFLKNLTVLPEISRIAGYMPSRTRSRGKCQQVITGDPGLDSLPVLKCWPFDGGRYITLPVVHTTHPESGSTNAGMYRMQVLDRKTTAMHWQRHKTGANHYEAWKRKGGKMPVTVTLGGDPVYAYAATAPLPENIDEYILAGFLRKEKVKLVKCITNDLYIPSDADIVIEGYIDTSEDLVWEGPFGDHTGFYSLADWYPRFHVTCMTHALKAVYPATIVGIPPQEDAWLAKATEKIFLTPLKLTLQPEIEDLHMPVAGVAHNLVIIKINKSYPGQGMKVISSLSGAGQMMFTKYFVVVSGDVDIRNYMMLAGHIFKNTDPESDIIFLKGPLDVLDHSSDAFSFGGKAGIDATQKLPEELPAGGKKGPWEAGLLSGALESLSDRTLISGYNSSLFNLGIPLLVVSANTEKNKDVVPRIRRVLESNDLFRSFCLVLLVDNSVDVNDLFMVAWQVLGNSDPVRDHVFISSSSVMIDGTIKAYREGGFTRRWPNIVTMDDETIEKTNTKWDSYRFNEFIPSPSIKTGRLLRRGNDEIITEDIPGK